MMKPLMIVSLFLVSFSAHSAGENSNIQANGGAPTTEKFEAKYGVYQGDSDADRLLKIPEVQKLYQECVTEKPSDVSECLWNDKLSKAENKATLDKVQEELDKMNNISETVKSEDKLKYEGRNLSNLRFNGVAGDPTKKNDISSSPTKKLEDYLFKKFTEAFYGNDPQKKKMMMDHNVFYDLYESQLGKNLISTVSSYAMDSEVIEGICLNGKDESDLKRIREKNIAALSVVQQGAETPDAYKSWNKCLADIESLCTKGAGHYNTLKTASNKKLFKQIYGSSLDDDAIDAIIDQRIESSQKKSCSAYRYIKDVRQALINTKALKEMADKRLGATEKNMLNPTKDIDFYKGSDNEKLLAITSQEVVATSEMDKEYEKKKEDLEKCSQDYAGTKAECDKYLLGSKEEKDKLITEYALRSRLQEKALEDDFNDDKDNENLKRYLKEEGRTEAQIAEILKQTEDKLAIIKDKIRDKYKQERTNLIKNLGDKLSTRTSEKEEADTATKFATIKKEFEDRPNYLKQVVFFNNIVSGFLEICKGTAEDCKNDKSKTSKNTLALEKELKSGAFVTENRGPASGTGSAALGVNINIDEIKRIAPTNNSGAQSSNDQGSNSNSIDVDQINSSFITVPTAP